MVIRYIGISVQVGARGTWSLKIIQNPPIFTENWRLPDTLFASLPLVSEKIWAACSDLCVIGFINLRKNSMQVQWKYMRQNETTSDPWIASCVPRPFTMQIEVNRFKTDSTWFKQISGNKNINKSLQSTVQKAPGLSGCQCHPAIVATPCFVPERGWPEKNM